MKEFVKEGQLVAMQLCFPGVTTPIVPEESKITALNVTSDGVVYGGTSGRKVHIFVAMIHADTGVVVDLGVIEKANYCTAVLCESKRLFVCVNSSQCGRIIAHSHQAPWNPNGCIQEWSFSRDPFDVISEPVPGEEIIHAVNITSGKILVGITPEHLFSLHLKSLKVKIHAEINSVSSSSQRIVAGMDGMIYGVDSSGSIWRFDPLSEKLKISVAHIPSAYGNDGFIWAKDMVSGMFYVVSATDGVLFSYNSTTGNVSELGRPPFTPVSCIAVTHDGRLFGICGKEIQRLFSYSPHTGKVVDLGIPVSVIANRRYGYEFADAVVGKNGEIYFGECDRGGHLWVYFPSIQSYTA